MTLKSGLQTSLKVIQTGTIEKLRCGFLVAFHSNYGSILHHLRDNARYWSKIVLLSHVSTLTGDIDIEILSVCPSVCLSVRDVPVSDENDLTYCHSFFHCTVAQSFLFYQRQTPSRNSDGVTPVGVINTGGV